VVKQFPGKNKNCIQHVNKKVNQVSSLSQLLK